MSGDSRESLTNGDYKQLEFLPFECHPEFLDQSRQKKWRCLMLPLICLFVIGNYYSYDEPAAL